MIVDESDANVQIQEEVNDVRVKVDRVELVNEIFNLHD